MSNENKQTPEMINPFRPAKQVERKRRVFLKRSKTTVLAKVFALGEASSSVCSSISSSSECQFEYTESNDYQAWNDMQHDGKRYLSGNCDPSQYRFRIDPETPGYYCSSDGIISWDSLSEGAVFDVCVECDVDDDSACCGNAAKASAKAVGKQKPVEARKTLGVPKVKFTKAAIKEGVFKVELTPLQLVGNFMLKLKNSVTGKETGVIYKMLNAPGMDYTISLDYILLGGQLDPHDTESYDTVVGFWTVPTEDWKKLVTPKDEMKFQDVAKVTVLKKWRLTKYFTPVWDAEWTGKEFEKGCYNQPEDGYPDWLVNVTLNADLLNSLSPENQGVAIIEEDGGTTVIRVNQDNPPQALVPGFAQVTWPEGSGYIMWPGGTQTDGYCNGGHWLKVDSCATHKNSTLTCGDSVYIPSNNDVTPKVRIVEDRGGFGGDDKKGANPLRHIDLWSGRGGSALKKEVFKFQKDRTCLRLNR